MGYGLLIKDNRKYIVDLKRAEKPLEVSARRIRDDVTLTGTLERTRDLTDFGWRICHIHGKAESWEVHMTKGAFRSLT